MPRLSANSTSRLVVLIAAIVGIATLYFARAVFVPLVLAALFAFVLTPVVRSLDRLHIPRVASSAGVVGIAIFAVGLASWFITSQLVDVANELPAYRSNVSSKIQMVRGSRHQSIINAASSVSEIGEQLMAPSAASGAESSYGRSPGTPAEPVKVAKPVPVAVVPPSSSPLESLNILAGPLTTFGIVTIFTFFILIRREDLRNRFIRLVARNQLNVMTQALDDASTRVSRYLSLQLSVNLGYGILVASGLYWIGIPHALLWGAIAAFLRFVPYIGFLLSAGLPLLLSFAMFDGWSHVLLTAGLYIVLELIISNLIEPLLYGAHLGLSSLAILVAALFWTMVWGPIGLVLSTPMTVCLMVIGQYVPNLRFLHILLGDEPVLAPESHFYQRLLAFDQDEARSVLENHLQNHTLQQLYDSLLIPALTLAERDRHRNELDETTQQFISLSTKEIIEELNDRINAISTEEAGKVPEEEPQVASMSPLDAKTVLCVPARDDADEIVGTMLAQVLEQAGHRSNCIPIGPVAEMLSTIEVENPDIICISALSPLALSHAKRLYVQLRARFASRRILIGLWSFPGDIARISRRMQLRTGDRVVATLDQALLDINGGADGREMAAEKGIRVIDRRRDDGIALGNSGQAKSLPQKKFMLPII